MFILFALVLLALEYLVFPVFCIWLAIKMLQAGKRVFDQLYYGTYLR